MLQWLASRQSLQATGALTRSITCCIDGATNTLVIVVMCQAAHLGPQPVASPCIGHRPPETEQSNRPQGSRLKHAAPVAPGAGLLQRIIRPIAVQPPLPTVLSPSRVPTAAATTCDMAGPVCSEGHGGGQRCMDGA
jgi:hypothetical protein